MEIWHNPRCSKSRAALALLEESGTDHTVRTYLTDPPTAARLDDVLTSLGMEPWDVVRSGEAEFKDLGMKAWPRDRKRWIDAMVANPKLIERPIVVTEDGRAAIGRPTDAVRDLL